MDLRSLIRTIPDHPRPGIRFRDVTTLLLEPEGLRFAVDAIAERHAAAGVDLVAGIEARGFVFGAPVAHRLGCGFLPMRKPGKLPGPTRGRDFELEYGRDRIEIHDDAVRPGQRILLVDDLIATGGTAAAAIELLREAGAEVVEACFVVALPELRGIERVEALGTKAFWLCAFDGD